jgi:hypothetical protein
MLRLLVGLALLPSSVLAVGAAAHALGAVASNAPASYPFLAGLAAAAAAWGFLRFLMVEDTGPASWLGGAGRKLYVFGHELTHALAAWSVGAKVLGFKVGEAGGHVDLSHSNAFIALAPYCLPIYTLVVVASYRALMWAKPGVECRGLFLAAMGATVAFHLLKTGEVLWDRRQPDLAAAGGVVFSLSLIALANGLVVMGLLKTLFPSAVPFVEEMRGVASGSAEFWRWSYRFVRPLPAAFTAQLRQR